MRQERIKVRRRPERNEQDETEYGGDGIDTRTPSGRPLPY